MSRPKKSRLDQLQGKKNVSTSSLETAATFTFRELTEGDRRLFPLNLAAGQAGTLPFATGKGSCYRVFVQTTITGSTTIVTQSGNNPKTGARDGFYGQAQLTGSAIGQFAANNSHTITMNGTTQGGIAGSYLELEDVAPGVWRVNALLCGSGTTATPFS